jgi:hypothetical protein
MKVEKPNCPKCGKIADGVLVDITGVALWSQTEGEFDWTGTTDVFWEEQTNQETDNQLSLLCRDCGCDWLSVVEEDED